jgi:hypothetical protein
MSTDKPKPAPAPSPAADPAAAADAVKRRFGKVDPGLATVTASALALLGTIVTVAIRAGDNGGGDAGPVATTQVVASPSATTSTGAPQGGLLVELPGNLTPENRALVEAAADQLLQMAGKLPLIVDDAFTTTDYAWPLGHSTADGGVTCDWAQADGRYDTSIHTGNGPSWCSNGLEKVAKDFALTADLALGRDSNSDVALQFRMSDVGATFYELRYTPQTQLFSFSFVGPEGAIPIVSPTFAAEINTSGSNRVTVLALGDTIALYFNDTLVASVTGAEHTLASGRVLVLLQLNESNSDETLSLTHFILRGK